MGFWVERTSCSAPPFLCHSTPPLPNLPTQPPQGADLKGAQRPAGQGPESESQGGTKPRSPGSRRSNPNTCCQKSRGPPGYSQTYLISFLQNGRNHVAPEVPTSVVVLLGVVRWNRGPHLGLQEAVGPGRCAHSHPIQNKALFESLRTVTKMRHPNHHSL